MEEKKKFLPTLVNNIRYSKKVKVTDIKQYLVDEFKLTNNLVKENKELRKELDKKEIEIQKNDLTLITLEEYKNRNNDYKNEIKDLNDKIKELKDTIKNKQNEISDLLIKEKETNKKLSNIDKLINQAKKEYKQTLIDLFNRCTGSLPKYKIKYIIETEDILYVDERAKKEL